MSPPGFRLQPPPASREDVCSSRGSVASYKQQIDSMFDDSPTESIDTEVNNMVQARIEKMFQEVEGEGETHRRQLEPSTFFVDYLGSLPLMKKVSSLEGLQEPLKDMYLHYKQMGNIRPVFKDVLEISNCGLRVKYVDEKQDESVEQLNPIPTIAVWAAVKLVWRPRGLAPGKEFGLEYAFMPLISDPQSVDKVTLFRKLTPNEACYFTGDYYSDHSPLFVAVMRKIGVSRQLECHGFVCKSNESAIIVAANLYKALVITMAKNQASEENGKKQNLKHKNGLSTVCSVGGSSLAGDLECLSISNNDTSATLAPKLPPANKEVGRITDKIVLSKVPPSRPPRRDRLSPVGNHNDAVILHVKRPDPDEILQLPCPPPEPESPPFLKSNSFNFSNAAKSEESSFINKRTGQKEDRNSQRRVIAERPNQSNQIFGGKHSSFCSKENSDRGDILTKVAIPRSHSFLNANGPLSSRYNRHSSAGPLIGNANPRKTSVGSPLGLNELFTEFRLQGLNNMEDILNAIIDPDGMSFNDLKPIYKEFLLKLAVTLTKDEMYLRSKSIMQQQKSRKKKISRKNSLKLRKTFSVGKGIQRVFRSSIFKLNRSKIGGGGLKLKSVLFPSCTRARSTKTVYKTTSYLKTYGFPYSSSSNDSTLLPKNRRKSFPVQQKNNFNTSKGLSSESKATTSNVFSRVNTRIKDNKPTGTSFSEDSDFFSLTCDQNDKSLQKNKIKIHGSENCLHQASSGYFSCSDCSYDSESCTCTIADKCYCSMGKQGQEKERQREEGQDKNVSLTSCECDTDSCFESEKCYCNQKRKPSLFEQLKQQGFAASESSLSRANSPNTEWQKNEADISEEKGQHNKGQLQSSKSLEFVKIKPRIYSAGQLKQESKYHRFNIYQSPVEAVQSGLRQNRRFKTSFSSSPMTSSSESKSNKSLNSGRRSYSSDNLALDYNMFSTNCKSDDERERKVLVVSTRDPKGRVIYMKPHSAASAHLSTSARSHSTDALSVKKSAEIAALFSDVKIKPRTSSASSVKEEVIYNTLEPPDYLFVPGSSHYSKTSLENSLGYFP